MNQGLALIGVAPISETFSARLKFKYIYIVFWDGELQVTVWYFNWDFINFFKGETMWLEVTHNRIFYVSYAERNKTKFTAFCLHIKVNPC